MAPGVATSAWRPPLATRGEPAARLPSRVLWELFLVTYLHQFDFLCLSGRLWEKLGLEIHDFLAVNEFQPNGKQGEVPV